MNGKRARELRRAARLLLGPAAPAEQLIMSKQKEPKAIVDKDGNLMGISGIRMVHSEDSVSGMYRKLKRNYRVYRKKSARTLDIVEKIAQSRVQARNTTTEVTE